MLTKVWLPGPLRKFNKGESVLSVEAETAGQALEEILKQCEGIKDKLYDEQGEIRKAFNVFVNDESIGSLGGLQTRLKEGDELSILVALSGG